MCCNDKRTLARAHGGAAPSEKRPSNRCCWNGGRVRTSPLLYSLGLKVVVQIVGFSFWKFSIF
jgi:hypothetical protein